MKKTAVLLLVILFLFAAGCAQKNSGAGSSMAPADAGEIADRIAQTITFQDDMTQVQQKTVVKNYGLNGDDVAQAKAYESSGATAEEIVVFTAADADAAGRILAAVKTHVEDRRAAFQDYRPAEEEKLKNPVLAQKGLCVVLVVADDPSPAQKIVDGLS